MPWHSQTLGPTHPSSGNHRRLVGPHPNEGFFLCFLSEAEPVSPSQAPPRISESFSSAKPAATTAWTSSLGAYSVGTGRDVIASANSWTATWV